jgi:hypothetical protein
LENLDDTEKIRPERISYLPSGFAAVHEEAGRVSPEKVAALTIRAHRALLNPEIAVIARDRPPFGLAPQSRLKSP